MISRLFNFLGGITFALILISLAILFVMAGTFIESWSDSHLYAARFTYKNPLFLFLIWGFFINILFSAIRRLPFKRRHIPFLLTHLGLLMILAGVSIKILWGEQGTLALTEGEATSAMILPGTYALRVENREGHTLVPLAKEMNGPFPLHLIEWSPHSEEKLEGWIKENQAHVAGLPPFPLGRPFKTSRFTLQVDLLDDKEQLTVAHGETKETLLYPDDAYLIFDKGYGGYAYTYEPLELFTPLRPKITPATPHKKLEELKPRVRLLADNKEIVTLAYDKYGSGFKWPLLDGTALIRFQSMKKELPHTIRLRQARQTFYEDTGEPESYSCDLLIDDKPVTLTMNHVHETPQKYRFYLSNIVDPGPLRAKKVQLVVSRDPAKRLLTYPGGIVLGIGSVLLFLRRYV